MARGRSISKPNSEPRCRHCRAPNDFDAPECWLCQRRDWRGARGIPSRDLVPLPERSPFATVRGLPGVAAQPRRPGGRRSELNEGLGGLYVLFIVIGWAAWTGERAVLGLVAMGALILLCAVIYERGRR